MKKKVIYTLSLLLLCQICARGQEADSLFNLVLENNRTLKVARDASQTAILRAGTGNTPPDPEIEIGYLYGDPGLIGNKVNIVVRQQVDFPTAYVHRSQLKDIRQTRAGLEYLLVRQEVLSNTRQIWIRQVHLNQQTRLLDRRLQQALAIRADVSEMMDAGEVGLLEYTQANLMVASLESESDEIQIEWENNRLALLEMTGGQNFEVRDTLFPAPVRLPEDSLLAAYRLGPGAQLHLQDRHEKEKEKSLAHSMHLPKLSAGYFSEEIPTEAFRGFTVGISVPLWENVRSIKTVQSALIASEAKMDQYLYEQERILRQKLNKLESLHGRVDKLEAALGSANSLQILTSSLENGEISLSEYFYNSDFYFRNLQLLLRYKKELLTLEADLMKIYY
jgi:outer membrane protein TolC